MANEITVELNDEQLERYQIMQENGLSVGEAIDLIFYLRDHYGVRNDQLLEERLEQLIIKKSKLEKEMKEKAAAAKNAEEIAGIAKIDITDFAKIDLRVAEITACEPVKKAKKLLKLTVFDGNSSRTVASGIAKWYKAEDLIGKKIILVSNLKPATLCGIESQGMILAADCSEDDVKVIFVDGIPAGAKVR